MRLARDILVLLALAAIPAAAAALLHPRAPAWSADALKEGEVTLEQAAKWGGDAIWVDARSAAVFEQGHVPTAVRLDETEWDALLPGLLREWEDGRPVVVYCDSAACNASHGVARRLREQVGLKDVHVLHGGWQAWKAARP